MKKLKLPVIKRSIAKNKVLSMDEYLKFIRFNLEQVFDKKAYAKWKKMLIVNTPFFIKQGLKQGFGEGKRQEVGRFPVPNGLNVQREE